ncbi:MAG: hybrid sensor histidine kinase/response regulator [Spartobacteria bacterium]|nr:hybrid sensor histidine kinase/response regulator [Spartobacteria bacterium]
MSLQDQELLAMFIEESREHLQQLEEDLIALEQNAKDQELINRIFRGVHSLKGSSGFFGLKRITELSHSMENLMSRVREGELPVTQQTIDVLLAGGDKLNTMVEDVDHSDGVDIAPELAILSTLLTGGTGEETSRTIVVEPDTETKDAANGPLCSFEIDETHIRDALKRGRFLYSIRVRTHRDMKDKGKNPLDYIRKLDSLGEFIDSHVDITAVDGLDDCMNVDIPFIFLFSTILEPDLVSMALEIPETEITSITLDKYKEQFDIKTEKEAPAEHVAETPEAKIEEPASSASPPAPAPATKATEKPDMTATANLPETTKGPTKTSENLDAAKGALQMARAKGDETIRVSVSLLDDLMNLAGEMVLSRNQLLRMAEGLAHSVSGLPGVMQNINLVTSDLQEKVMKTRMQPVNNIFSKFNRILRDMSRQLDKDIALVLTGEDVELDKTIIETLSDPLTHLVRNCADHGLEPPDEREKAGKPRTGTVHLTARHEGGQVHIEIVDDGRGINPEKIKAKAIDKGLLTTEQARQMSDREAFLLVFAPGFSTADVVSDISGRGVGMDVVRTNIEGLGGTVELESEMGKGTRVNLRLPLTLAIIPSMIVLSGNRRYAVPQVNLEELVRLGGDTRIESVRGADVMRLRGRLLPLVRLTELLGKAAIETAPSATEESPPQNNGTIQQTKQESAYVLVLKVGDNRFGMVVDALLDNEEIVVKPLSSYLKNCKCYAGSTIMGDGRIAMILDAPGVAALADLRFNEINEADKSLALHSEERRTGEMQSLLLFRNAGKELLALNLDMVARIEKIKAQDLEKIGNKEFLKYRDSSLRVLRIHDFLPITPPEDEPEWLYVIVPKLVKHPMGLIATKVEDVIETAIQLDQENIAGPGLMGSAIIGKDLTVFIDIYGLFEIVDPERYKASRILSGLENKRILLAEDTAFFRTVELQYLESISGITTDVAVDGAQAWAMLNKADYDLVITDIEMPEMDGFELTSRIRSSDKLKNIPVIAITALRAEHYQKRGYETGVDSYQIKFDKDSLSKAIEQLLTNGRHGTGGKRQETATSGVAPDSLVELDS